MSVSLQGGAIPTALRARLRTALEAQLTATDRLLTLLAEEQETLRQRHPEALAELATEKARTVATLEARYRDLVALLPGAKPGPAMTDLLRRDPELGALWDTLEERLRASRERNLVNGAIIQNRRQSTGRALALLTGRGPQQETYGRDGRTGPGPASGGLLGEA